MRRRQLLDALEDARRYWKLKESSGLHSSENSLVSLEEAMYLSQDRLLLELEGKA
jgi:hypothetical protein